MGNRKLLWLSLLLALSLPLYLAGCGGSSSEAPGEPGGPGIFTANVSAGNGTVSHTHEAGSFEVYSYPGGGIHVFSGGKADPAFTVNVPSATPGFGPDALVVADNLMKIAATTVLDTAPDNVVKFYLGPRTFNGGTMNTLWHRQADNVTFKMATGIQVPAGKVLELGMNFDPISSGTAIGLPSASYLTLANDVEVAGTLRTAAFDCAATQLTADPNSRAGLWMNAAGVFIRSTGKVTTAGASTASGPAGHGGVIRLSSSFGNKNGGLFLNEGTIDASGGNSADNTGGNGSFYGGYYDRYWNGVAYYEYVYNDSGLSSEGYLINKGTVNISGGNGGTDGGNSSSLYVDSDQYLYNTGAVSAKGGNGTNGNGGGTLPTGTYFDGETAYFQYDIGVELLAHQFNVYNSGPVTATGGNGKLAGQSGGWIDLGNDDTGNVLNSGALNASGGTASTSPGTGGSVNIFGFGGKLATSGDISVNGGATTDNSAGYHGGSGGYISILSGDGWFDSAPRPNDEVAISGNLMAKGGNGYYGNSGGHIYVENRGSLAAGSKGGVTFFGYADILANGGRGVSGGYAGSGGYVRLDSRGSRADLWRINSYNSRAPVLPPGPIVNRAAISANGGAADNASAGSAGAVYFVADENPALGSSLPAGLVPNPTITNSGAISANGGSSNHSGTGGGYVQFSAISDISSSGAVTLNGGANITDNGYFGGDGGEFDISSSKGNATVSGGLAFNGGASKQYAGDGGSLYVDAKLCSVSGTVAANGGNATFSDGTTFAGWGGFVQITSQAPPSAVSATVSVVKGTGGKLVVRNGSVVIDGIDRVSAGGTFP